MTWTQTILDLKDANGATQPVIAYTDGTNYSFAHPLLDNTGSIIAPATSTNQTTANAALAAIEAAVQASLPTGSNLIGSVNIDIAGAPVSASNPLFIEDAYLAPVAVNWTSATAANTAQTSTTNGMDTVIVSFVPNGTITAGAITFEVFDGAAWLPIKAARIESYNTEGSYTLTGGSRGWQIPVAGFPQFRVRLSTAITGSGTATVTTIVSSAPDTSVVTVGIDPASTVPLPTGAASAANQASEIASLASIATNSTAVPGVIAMTVGTAATAGRSFAVHCTTAGNVNVTFSDGSSNTYPVSVGLNVFPFAVTTVNSSGTTATATYENWK